MSADRPSPPNDSSEHPAGPCVLTINGGSSSIKFALYTLSDPPTRTMVGLVDRVGQPTCTLRATGPDDSVLDDRPIQAADLQQTAAEVARWVGAHVDPANVVAIGHRIVHGGANLVEHQLVTPELVEELRRSQPLALVHLPGQIALIEAFDRQFSGVAQVACLDTAFHCNLPRVAQLLPIPRRYFTAGVRRFGFHGLSYAYLMAELEHVAGPRAAAGRVILAHLGAGCSMVAVDDHRPVDTSMAFTPSAGLMMATRPGDFDPGLLAYLMRIEKLSPEQAEEFVNRRCGLLGVSETTADMRDLLAHRAEDPRAADAVALFCRAAKKWIGAGSAVLGGLDTLVFAGGIGEHGAQVRAEICDGLGFIGVELDPERNAANAPVISRDDSPVTVRVMHTDEELMMVRCVRAIMAKAAS